MTYMTASDTRWTSVGRRSRAESRFEGKTGPYTAPITAVEMAFSTNDGTRRMRRCMTKATTVVSGKRSGSEE